MHTYIFQRKPKSAQPFPVHTAHTTAILETPFINVLTMPPLSARLQTTMKIHIRSKPAVLQNGAEPIISHSTLTKLELIVDFGGGRRQGYSPFYVSGAEVKHFKFLGIANTENLSRS